MGRYDEREEYICNGCSGSGEGYYEGSTCNRCNGSGSSSVECDEYDYRQQQDEFNEEEWNAYVEATGGNRQE